MSEKKDWRLSGQERYLKGVPLIWKAYKRYSDSWDHDHCEFCWAKFSEEPAPDLLTEGYSTLDNYRWICEHCFEDFRDLFEWRTETDKQ